MKILIIPSWYPNAENKTIGSFFHEQAALLSANGYDMKILFGNTKIIGRKKFLKNKFRIPGSQRPILNKTFLLQEPEALSFEVNQLNQWKEGTKYNFLCDSYAAAFSELIGAGWKPDLIHAQCTADGGIVAEHLSRKFNIPYVIIEHQVFLLNQFSEFKQALIKNALQKASKVGAVSEHQKRCILSHTINCKPNVIWNYVDEQLFQIVPKKTDSKFRILAIAYPAFIKDMDTFFRSMEVFSKSVGDDFEIVVVGNNSFADLSKANTLTFESLAKKYNVYSKCVLIPYLSRTEVAATMNRSNVFVSTSIAETFGVAVREAMYCGIPVISTRSGGVEDSINEKTGILVNIGDHESIAKAMLEIKNGKMNFDPATIRNFAVSQCGENFFLSEMKKFYELPK